MAKKDMAKINDNKPVNFTFNFSDKQNFAYSVDANEIFFGGSKGSGKLLDLDTPILTKSGWKTMGTIHPGDYVFGDDGKPTKVIAESEIDIEEETYELIFDDGSSIIERKKTRPSRGKGEKQWLAEINSKREYKYDNSISGGIRTTKDIFNTFKTSQGYTNHAIPVAKALVYPEQWELFEKLGYKVSHSTKDNIHHCILGLKVQLRELNLLNNKHIPDIYKYSSYAQRVELLRGLFDADGTIAKRGKTEISLSDERLFDDTFFVLSSLGIKCNKNKNKAYLHGVRKKDRYRTSFSTTIPLFHLPRKLERVPKKVGATTKFRYICGISKIENRAKKCIEVDNSTHLYLVGKALIPTHNSHLIRYASILYSLAVPGLQTYLFRRTSKQVRSNHLFGSTGYMSVLKPFIDAGKVDINQSDNRIDFFHKDDNGNSLPTSSIFLRHCQYQQDVEVYRGCEIHFLIMDELTHFTAYQYKTLRSCVRLGLKVDYKKAQEILTFYDSAGVLTGKAEPGFFPRILCASNPGNIGHQWVKSAWIDSMPPNTVRQMPDEDGGMKRIFVEAKLEDNYHLLESDPSYKAKLIGVGGDAARAMLAGDWNIASGSALADCWDAQYNVIEPFDIPDDWHIDRSFDWGSAKPFAVCYFAEATGTSVRLHNGQTYTPPNGTVFMIGEIYGNDPDDSDPDKGCKWSARRVGAALKEYEDSTRWGYRVLPGAGDGQIFEANRSGTDENINDNLLSGYNSYQASNEHASYINQHTEELFIRADKSKGSRKKGLELLRSYLLDAHYKDVDGELIPSEEAGFILFENCTNAIRTLPAIPRDEHDPEDVNSEAPDHIYDVCRYRLASRRPQFQTLDIIGL